MANKSSKNQQRKVRPFSEGMKEIGDTLFQAWRLELKTWLCSRKEAHETFGALKGTEALARVAHNDVASSIYDEAYAET